MRRRYPFDALQRLRQARVDEHARAVAERTRCTAQARAAEAEAERARRSTELGIDELSRAERGRLDQGLLCAGDLRTLADWRTGADAELELRTQSEHEARKARLNEAAAEVVARRALGDADRQAKLVDSHRGSFSAAQSALEERSDEEAAAEQWTAHHFRSRRG